MRSKTVALAHVLFATVPFPRFRDKPLVVVGGGDSAVEEATYLSKYASTVYLVHRRDELRASKIMAQRAIDNEKIEIMWNSQVDEVLGDDENGMTGIRLASTVDDSKKELEAGGMFFGHRAHAKHLVFEWPNRNK